MIVRRSGPDDEAVVRDLRLRAITDAPDAFDSNLERERGMTADERRAWLRDRAVFVLERDGDPMGIAAGEPHADDPGAVFLASVWVDPAIRGTGAAATLVAPVFDWAQARGAREVHLHVGKRNDRARRFYESCGFQATGREIRREGDGLVEIEMRRAVGGAMAPPGPSV